MCVWGATDTDKVIKSHSEHKILTDYLEGRLLNFLRDKMTKKNFQGQRRPQTFLSTDILSVCFKNIPLRDHHK